MAHTQPGTSSQGAGNVDLTSRSCKPCEGQESQLKPDAIAQYNKSVPDWQVLENKQIFKEFKFGNHYETMAFVNAVAWISHREDHHPDMEVGYNKCKVRYTTHAIGGLSENDFICAAKVDSLLTL